MQDIIENVITYLKDLVLSNNILISIIIGFFIIVLESIIPILPLALFIALNMIVLGNFMGFILSWIAEYYKYFFRLF